MEPKFRDENIRAKIGGDFPSSQPIKPPAAFRPYRFGQYALAFVLGVSLIIISALFLRVESLDRRLAAAEENIDRLINYHQEANNLASDINYDPESQVSFSTI